MLGLNFANFLHKENFPIKARKSSKAKQKKKKWVNALPRFRLALLGCLGCSCFRSLMGRLPLNRLLRVPQRKARKILGWLCPPPPPPPSPIHFCFYIFVQHFVGNLAERGRSRRRLPGRSCAIVHFLSLRVVSNSSSRSFLQNGHRNRIEEEEVCRRRCVLR